MEKDRRTVVESYVRHYEPVNGYIEGYDAVDHVRPIIERVREDVPDAPFYKQLDDVSILSRRSVEQMDFQYDPLEEVSLFKHQITIIYCATTNQ